MAPPDNWSARTADAIGRQVRHYRQVRGLSVQQVANALAELGVVIQRPVLSNLENGRRHTVTAAEVLALARVLKIPPVELLLPIGQADRVEVIPGTVVDTWRAVQWCTGERTFPGDEIFPSGDEDFGPDLRNPMANSTTFDHTSLDYAGLVPAVAFYRDHDRLLRSWQRIPRVAVAEEEEDAVSLLEARREQLRRFEYLIQRLRELMQSLGYTPPAIPDALAAKLEAV